MKKRLVRITFGLLITTTLVLSLSNFWLLRKVQGLKDQTHLFLTEQQSYTPNLEDFLMHFFERYLSYNNENFTPSQLQLLPLFSDAAGQKRQTEIQEIFSRIQEVNFQQMGRLFVLYRESISQINHFGQLAIEQTTGSKKKHYLANFTVSIAATTPSLLNPWGHQINSLTITELRESTNSKIQLLPFTFFENLRIKAPCQIDRITPDNLKPTLFYQADQGSNAKVITQSNLTKIEVSCSDQFYTLSANTVADSQLKFIDLAALEPEVRKTPQKLNQEKTTLIPRELKPLEKDLNFIFMND